MSKEYNSRTKEGCDRSSEVGTVYSGFDVEGPVPLRKPKESGKRGSCEKDSSPSRVASVPSLCNDRGQRAGNMGWSERCSIQIPR